MNPNENLCYHDPRNPRHDDFDETIEPRNGCACDNCFYGRDKLALEIIRLREELGNIANAKPSQWPDPWDFKAWAQNRARHAINQ